MYPLILECQKCGPPFLSSQVTYCRTESVFSLSALEANLVSYVKNPEAQAEPFDAESIPKISREQAAKESARECHFNSVLFSMTPVY